MICECVFERLAGEVTHTVNTIKNVIITITHHEYHNELQDLSPPLHLSSFLHHPAGACSQILQIASLAQASEDRLETLCDN